jgi:uncharacterized protein with HEPN domain
MKPDDRVRLRHIADALGAAIRFTDGRSREDLDKDEMLAFALLHAIQIVGEAAVKVSAELRDQHPEIPWALITGMRHRLVHAYSMSITTSCGRRLPNRFLNSWPRLIDFSRWTEGPLRERSRLNRDWTLARFARIYSSRCIMPPCGPLRKIWVSDWVSGFRHRESANLVKSFQGISVAAPGTIRPCLNVSSAPRPHAPSLDSMSRNESPGGARHAPGSGFSCSSTFCKVLRTLISPSMFGSGNISRKPPQTH